jgi:protein-arginine kinase activator protein McsA
MERQKGKTVITMETFQRTTIRSRKTAEFALCERCAAELSPSETAAHPQTRSEALQLIEPGEADHSRQLPGDEEL